MSASGKLVAEGIGVAGLMIHVEGWDGVAEVIVRELRWDMSIVALSLRVAFAVATVRISEMIGQPLCIAVVACPSDGC